MFEEAGLQARLGLSHHKTLAKTSSQPPQETLAKTSSQPPQETRNIVGGLRYLVLTRTDIAFAVGYVRRFIEDPERFTRLR